VRRAFAGVDLAKLDPFVHLDQMGEVDYGPGEPKGTPWHPHRGFETVTYMIDGIIEHHDSTGGGGRITDGDTQWMTAGSGLLHIETPPDELVATGGIFHGLQLWVNLPRAKKWIDPRYQEIDADRVTLLASDDGGGLIRLIAGDIAENHGPGSTHTPITMVHATLTPGARLSTPWPADFNALVYILGGNATVGVERRPLETGQLAVLGGGDAITIDASQTQDTRTDTLEVLMLGGRPIGEPVAWYGPFVMNTEAEIRQAFDDFEAGRLGSVPASVDAPTDEVQEQIDAALD
jgi:redox-sensitive bicupin YhaK (pirin superfamily)